MVTIKINERGTLFDDRSWRINKCENIVEHQKKTEDEEIDRQQLMGEVLQSNDREEFSLEHSTQEICQFVQWGGFQ